MSEDELEYRTDCCAICGLGYIACACDRTEEWHHAQERRDCEVEDEFFLAMFPEPGGER